MLNEIVVFKKARQIYTRFNAIPANGKRFTKTFVFRSYLIYSLGLLPGVLGNFFYLWRILTKDKVSITSTLECLHVNAEILAAMLSGFVGIYYGNAIFEFFYHLGIYKFGKPNGLAEVYKKHDKISNYLYYSTLVTVLSRITFNSFRNSYCEAKETFLDERYICGMMLPFWLPFRTNFLVRTSIFLVSNIVFAIFIPVSAVGYFIVYGVADLIVLRMKKLEQMLKQLDFEGTFEMVNKQLLECIQYHCEIWNLVNLMNDSMGWCYIFQYSLVSGIIALIEYELILSSNFTCFFQLSIWIVGEFMLCSAGQNLENEKEAMTISLYMTPWYDLPIKLRSKFCIFLAKMQMPLHLKARPVIHLNYDFFMKVVKASYTFLMFLKNKSN